MRQISYCILFFICSCSGSSESVNDSQDSSEVEVNLLEVKPPFGEEKIPFVAVKVNPEKDTFVVFESGTFLDIPKDAFLDESGAVVTTPVDIKFREFKDPVDFFVSGIPMTLSHDENGIEYFQSAGMTEVKAESNGKEVFPNPESKIELGLASPVEGDYPLYYFTPGKGWDEVGETKNITPKQMDSVVNVNVPSAPLPLDVSVTFFSIDDETVDEIPALKKYKGYTFAPEPESECDGATYIKNLEVKEKGNGKYRLIITDHGRRVRECDCERVYGKIEYGQVSEAYLKKYGGIVKRQLIYVKATAKMEQSSAIVNRTFRLDNFGIYNCDRLYLGLYDDVPFSTNLSGRILLYAVDYTSNAVYPCSQGKRLSIEPKNEVGIYGASEKGDIYFSSVSKTKGAKKDNAYKLELTKCNNTSNLDELKKAMRN